ncbi:hypothetical protein [Chamaesiphon sp. VAR_48_metabat_403]|uniref:hypothetical protein n=1 Tax=Chamaesiphon sp. VAR_48_metabat_403 TaxID=2964700 RepID=UPI00286E1771|nr:hypothetical protein [Chamaesiphon sp. VAR_48_metabat_403]
MTLAENFNSAEHLQDVLFKVQNKIVRDEFNDVGDDDWVPSIATSRGSLRVACTHDDRDSVDMTNLRLWLFYVVLRKCVDFHPAIFGTPSTSFQETTKYYPQIHLYFEEKTTEVEAGYKALRSQVSLRLIDESASTLSVADATTIANRIKSLFVSGTRFFWKRGKFLFSYIDQSKGYYFQLLCFSEIEAKKIIEQVLDIRSHTPDWKLLNQKTNAEPVTAYPTVPGNKTILGKSYKQPRRRPVGTVYFTHAVVHVYGKPTPTVLVDPDRRYRNALVN